MICFRVDANNTIGMGHLMRCLTVAKAFLKSGKEVLFVCADRKAGEFLDEKNMKNIVLNTDYRLISSETDILSEIIEQYGVDLLIVDSYYADNSFYSSVKRLAKLCIIEDELTECSEPDVIINYNIYAKSLGCEEQYKNALLLLGGEYAPLREEFATSDIVINDVARRVLITTGGADMYNLSSKLVTELVKDEALSDIRYVVVSGKFNEYIDNLRTIEKQYPNVEVHENVTDMAKLMSKVDVAITSGGSTLSEVMCMGIPTIAFSFVDNQKLQVKTAYDEGYVFYATDYDSDVSMLVNIKNKLKYLIGNNELRKEYSKAAMMAVSKDGAEKIVRKISENVW